MKAIAALCALVAWSLSATGAEPPATLPPPTRFEENIRRFEEADQKHPPEKGGIVFLGSSSIRLWKLEDWFPGQRTVNRGFGGSTYADCDYYFERVVLPHQPSLLVLYAGDNDIAARLPPTDVVRDFRQLVLRARKHLPDCRIVCISIKPSIKRWPMADAMRRANKRIAEFAKEDGHFTFVDVWPRMLDADGKPRRELYVADELHLSSEGYRIWSELLRPILESVPAR